MMTTPILWIYHSYLYILVKIIDILLLFFCVFVFYCNWSLYYLIYLKCMALSNSEILRSECKIALDNFYGFKRFLNANKNSSPLLFIVLITHIHKYNEIIRRILLLIWIKWWVFIIILDSLILIVKTYKYLIMGSNHLTIHCNIYNGFYYLNSLLVIHFNNANKY